MGEDDLETRPPGPEPPQKPRSDGANHPDRDLAEQTGYVAGRTASGLTRLMLRSKTVRQTLRNARNASRDED